jgi:hypothetical protein
VTELSTSRTDSRWQSMDGEEAKVKAPEKVITQHGRRLA